MEDTTTSELKVLAQTINREHKTAQAATEQYRESARMCGESLITAKGQVQHGEWLQWLAENCPDITERTARHYMRFARGDAEDLWQGSKSARRADLEQDSKSASDSEEHVVFDGGGCYPYDTGGMNDFIPMVKGMTKSLQDCEHIFQTKVPEERHIEEMERIRNRIDRNIKKLRKRMDQ